MGLGLGLSLGLSGGVGSAFSGVRAGAGAFVLTGSDATLRAPLAILAEGGVFVLTGQDAALDVGNPASVTAEPGSFAFLGADAGLLIGRVLTAEAGAVTLTGQDATLTEGSAVVAVDDTATVAPDQAINIRVLGNDQGSNLVIDAATVSSGPGIVRIETSDGSAIDSETETAIPNGEDYLWYRHVSAAEAGAFALTGADAGLLIGRTLAAEVGAFVLAGQDATLTEGTDSYTLTAEAGSFTLTGQDATLTEDGGGASGNFTFSLAQSAGGLGDNVSDPKQRTMASAITAGNALFCLVAERSGGGIASHNGAVTDNNGKTWTRLTGLDIDNSVGGNEANTRMSMSVWWRVVDATGETNSTPTVTADLSVACDMMVAEVAPSAAYNWALATGTPTAVAGSGAADWDNLNSGNASPTGDDICVIGMAASRFSTDRPADETADMNFDEYATKIAYRGASNAIGFIFGINTTSQAAGSYSSTVDTGASGTGNEGVCGTLGMRDAP